jgi:carbamoyl-phosphate synthase small subunit
MSATYKISVLDLGIKTNILRNLAKKRLLHQSILMRLMKSLSSFNPDGYFLSNGPGDPEPLSELFK